MILSKVSFAIPAFVLLMAGCTTPNPEILSQLGRDSGVYTPPAGEMKRQAAEKRSVAIFATYGNFASCQDILETLDAKLTEMIHNSPMFSVVERQNISWGDADGLITGKRIDVVIPADYILDAKIRSGGEGGGILTVDFRLYDVQKRELLMVKSISEAFGRGKDRQIVGQRCAEAFARVVRGKLAPPARIIETRGDLAVAFISRGTEYGLLANREVRFFELVDNPIEPGKFRKDVVGRGWVMESNSEDAWVEIYHPKQARCRVGDFVEVIDNGDQPVSRNPFKRFIEKLKDVF